MKEAYLTSQRRNDWTEMYIKYTSHPDKLSPKDWLKQYDSTGRFIYHTYVAESFSSPSGTAVVYIEREEDAVMLRLSFL